GESTEVGEQAPSDAQFEPPSPGQTIPFRLSNRSYRAVREFFRMLRLPPDFQFTVNLIFLSISGPGDKISLGSQGKSALLMMILPSSSKRRCSISLAATFCICSRWLRKAGKGSS